MATVDKQSGSDQRWPDNAHQEAEKLLTLAEALDAKCQNRESQIAVFSLQVATGFSLVVLLVGILWATLFRGPSSETWMLTWASIAVVCSAAIIFFALQHRSRMRRHLQRDQRALYQIVGMLRELESAISERDNLSALERAEFRIRLSRFDIGPDYYHPQRW
jgi:ABC-type multidrug transport system fused ATPase/permease subunit